MSNPHADKIHKLIRDKKKMAQNLKRKKKKYQPVYGIIRERDATTPRH